MSQTLEKMANHLEFLGYSIQMNDPKAGGNPSFNAKHSQYPNFFVWEWQPGLTLIRSSFAVDSCSSLEEKNAAINELSGKVDLVNPFYEQENGKGVLRFETFYTGEYSKEVFGNFISVVHKDIDKMYKIPSVTKAFS
jgi:hypothetical protein